MHARILVFATATVLVAPAGSIAAPGPAPQPRKTVGTTGSAKPPTRVATKAPPKAAGPRRIGQLRKGTLPDSAARVKRKAVAKPSARLLASKAARKPVRLGALPKPVKVAFSPCGASLPPQAPRVAKPKAGMDAAVVERQYRWPTGATLKVGFLDGSRAAREAVARTARAWTDHANLAFEFSLDAPPQQADILIRFDAPGCTSHVGTSSRYYAEVGQPSMHLCHMDQWIPEGTDPTAPVPDGFRRIVLHEFGHALGLHHEHQSPDAKFQWNELAVYDYYGTVHGWDRDYVDMWIFRQLDPRFVDVSQYDPVSVMHYDFPAQFTTNGVAYAGAYELSALDKEHIAKTYPRQADTKAKRRFERKIAVRNDTGTALDVQVVYQGRKGKRTVWQPASDPLAAPTTRVAAGDERMLEGQGRQVKVVARSADGHSTWSEWAAAPLRISPQGGYLDVEPQTYVIVIDGPPDPPSGQTSDELYAAASQAQAAGDHEGARALFDDFAARFPADPLVPWARLNVVVSWYEQKRWQEALEASYDLIVDHPDADPTIYGWYYGGVASLQLGWCDGARGYLEYVESEASGAPAEWRSAAREYLAAVAKDPDRWCW